jgi:hypothetical protein
MVSLVCSGYRTLWRSASFDSDSALDILGARIKRECPLPVRVAGILCVVRLPAEDKTKGEGPEEEEEGDSECAPQVELLLEGLTDAFNDCPLEENEGDDEEDSVEDKGGGHDVLSVCSGRLFRPHVLSMTYSVAECKP